MSERLFAIDPGKNGPALAVFRRDMTVSRLTTFRLTKEQGQSEERCAVSHQIASMIVRTALRSDDLLRDELVLAVEGPKLNPYSGTMVKGGKKVPRPTNTMTIDLMARLRQALYEVFHARTEGCFAFVEPTPTQVKKVTGSGRAKKEDVIAWARASYPDAMAHPDIDGTKWKMEAAADALAIGWAGAVLLGWR